MEFKSKIKGLLELMRIPHLAFSLPIAIAAAFMASNGAPDSMTLILVFLVTGLNHAGGHVMNDFYDRFIDATNPRTKNRAIPSGRVKPLEALLFGALLFLGAFFIALFINITGFIIALVGATLALLYSISLKNKGIWGHISCALVTALPVIFGWIAVGETTFITYIIFLIVFTWELGHNILAASSDYISDKESNITTLPVKVGLNISSIIVMICYSSIILIVLTVESILAATTFLALIILSSVLAFQGIQFLFKSSQANAKYLFIQSSLFLPLLAMILIFY